jgi:hypothetical protein
MLWFPNHKTFCKSLLWSILHENNMPKMLFYIWRGLEVRIIKRLSIFYTLVQSDLDEQGSKLHVLMVTSSVESKEMSCADLSWLLLLWQRLAPTAHRRMHQWGTGDFWQILGATAAWFAPTSSVHENLTSSADLQCLLELFVSSLVWHSADWNLYSAVEDRISICTKMSRN